MQITHKVLIDGKAEELTLVYHTGNGNKQYNTTQNVSAHNFNVFLTQLPKHTEIKTNGHTYLILT